VARRVFKSKANKGTSQISLLALAGSIACLAIFSSSILAQKSRRPSSPQTKQVTAEQMLSIGELYYNNAEIDGKAAQQFSLVIKKYPNSREAEKAQYYLGSYYQRKYYIQRERLLGDDRRPLDQAVFEYRKFISRYSGGSDYLSDARFNLFLVFSQLGELQAGASQLENMNEQYNRDTSVYIYQVAWSSNSKDVIDGSFDASLLASYALSISSISSFDNVLTLLKRWCKSQRSR
jgi:hypothetical protein